MNPAHAPITFRLAVSRLAANAAAAVSALALAACADVPETYELRGRTMGTAYSIKIVAATGESSSATSNGPPFAADENSHFNADDGSLFNTADGPALSMERLADLIHTELDELEDTFSTYRPESEVSRFNAYSGEGWFPVSPEFLGVLKRAVEVSEFTGGAFDATVGSLVELWGFGVSGGTGRISSRTTDLELPGMAGRIAIGDAGAMPAGDAAGISWGDAGGIPVGKAPRLPSREAVERLLASTGFSRLQIRETPPAVRRLRPGVQLDFSAIAKGYAVDRVWSALSESGLSDYLVEIGGEVRSSGLRADGRAWSIGIESPDQAGVTEAVPLRNAAIATSGDYRNFFEHEGERYSHVLDPRTGWPVSHGLASVTVIASSAATADALATALLVLGPDRGLQLAVDHGLAARLVVRTAEGWKVLATPAYEAGFGR